MKDIKKVIILDESDGFNWKSIMALKLKEEFDKIRKKYRGKYKMNNYLSLWYNFFLLIIYESLTLFFLAVESFLCLLRVLPDFLTKYHDILSPNRLLSLKYLNFMERGIN